MSSDADKTRRAHKRRPGRPPANNGGVAAAPPGAAKAAAATAEQNNNSENKPAAKRPRTAKDDMLAAYQPWVVRTYGDLAKTKTVTLKKYARIVRTLRGDEVVSADNSKFRFWVKAKGFCVGRPPGYDAKPADAIVGRFSVCDADGGIPPLDGKLQGSAKDPPLYVPNVSFKNSTGEPVYRKVAVVENFFDIIYNVHVDLEGRPGKHAGQKRTYRTITETYAFLPREAVTRFLLGCTECQKQPPPSPSPPPPLHPPPPHSLLPTPSPSPTPPAGIPGGTKVAVGEVVKTSPINTRSSVRNDLKNTKSPNNHTSPTNNNSYPAQSQPKHPDASPAHSNQEPKRAAEPREKQSGEPGKEDKGANRNGAQQGERGKAGDAGPGEKSEVERCRTENRRCENPLDVINLTTPKSARGSEVTRSKIWSPFKSIEEEYQQRSRYQREATLPHDIDYSMPITTTYLKYMRSVGCREEDAFNFNGKHVSSLLEQFLHDAIAHYYHN